MPFVRFAPPFLREVARALARALIVLLAFSHASLAFASLVSPSHDPLRSVLHAHDTAGTNAEDAAHDHDHGDLDDKRGTHQHGHDPADHSHDKPNLPSVQALAALEFTDQWTIEERRLVYPSPCSSLERPPKRLAMM